MKTRELGRSGLAVSAIGLGCMGMSEFYGSPDDAESVRVIQRALELGVTFIDTADMYGRGHNEQLVGKALAGRRDGVVLATKFGNVRDAQTGAYVRIDGRPEYVREACDASLRRLGLDVIDLYYQHRVDRQTPIEETVGAMQELVEAGKVRHLGLSEAQPADIRRAAATAPIAALQSEYSLFTREVEREVLGVCEELGIGFVPFSPLGRGVLTGRFRTPDDYEEGDVRRTGRFPRAAGANLEHNVRLAGEVVVVAARHGATAGQVALAWLLARRPWIVPIPGTKRLRYLEENAGAVELELGAADIARLDALVDVAGDRYEPGVEATWVSPPL